MALPWQNVRSLSRYNLSNLYCRAISAVAVLCNAVTPAAQQPEPRSSVLMLVRTAYNIFFRGHYICIISAVVIQITRFCDKRWLGSLPLPCSGLNRLWGTYKHQN